MPALLIRHKVTDYPAWKLVFDEQQSTRWSNGCRGGQVFRSAADPSEILVLLAWDDVIRARLFSLSDELRESIQRAGITDDPDVWILEQTDDTSDSNLSG